jgi:hypothetical protein
LLAPPLDQRGCCFCHNGVCCEARSCVHAHVAHGMVAHGMVLLKNESPVPIIVNGINITAGLEVEIELLLDVTLNLVLEVLNVTGTLVKGSYYCPSEVTKLALVQVDVGIKIVVTGVSCLFPALLGTVVGLLDQT